MRNFFTIILSLCFTVTYAQEKNSLLWEISGNGLEQTSYLYGTMHVSKRIAFRLDDVFYQALEKSDVVALESDPDTWLDNDINANAISNGFMAKGFYTYPFAIKNPKKEEIGAYLAFEDRRVNSILYRTNEYSQNFEEETYLDMFIYQAGKKFGKKVIALEDLEESSALVGRASLNAMKKKPDEWLQKKMQESDPMTLLQDAYRNRDINMLDSIDKAMYTDHYRKNMLTIRNRNMATKLDSVMRKAKVFTGIGAAHLPGKLGVITMLRDMGYTVKPLTSRATSRGRILKQKIEDSLVQNTYQTVRPDDDFFSIDLPNKLYPISEFVNTTYISPDLANGSYVMLNRINTFSHLKKEYTYSLEDLDKLLFENIPGKIIEKTRFTRNGYEGLDIKNRLKNGDHQRYHIYVTPLEILMFKMGGKGNYVTQYSDTIFNSIQFKKLDKKIAKISSGYDDFEVNMPQLYNFTNRYRKGQRLVQAYDSITKNYYFLRKVTLNDFNFIEEDTFELKQIQKRFYQDLELTPKYKACSGNSLTSQAVLNKKENTSLHLKTTFKRGDYYLMGIVTKNEEQATAFFDSFKLKKPIYQDAFKKVQDTAMLFSTVSPVKPVKFVENSRNYYNSDNKPKSYSAYNKKSVYQNKNNEAITVELNKSHDFLMFSHIDSVWALRKKIYANKRFKIHSEKDSMRTDGEYELNLTLTDTASTRGILIKNIVKNGLLYEVKSKVDTIDKPSRFVTEFFQNFSPFDTVVGKSILNDKTTDFFRALRENDSIVSDGYSFIKFQKKHIDSLKYYISEFDFPEDKNYIQSFLIQKLAKLDDPQVNSFFKEFYAKSYNNSNAQTKILTAITKKADEESVDLLLELMSKDLPLVSNKFEIHKIFKPYMDSLPMARKLYPEILDYSAIEEYKSPIFMMLANLKAKGLIKPKSYKKYRKQILNDAKIQLKRQLGRRLTNSYSGQNYHDMGARPVSPSGVSLGSTKVLEDYAVLLYPFLKEKDVKQFFNRLLLVKDPKIRTTYAALLAKNELTLPLGMLDSLAADINSRSQLFNKLKVIGKQSLFPTKYRNEQSLAEANLFGFKRFDAKKDSVSFIEKRSLEYRGKSFTGYYFKTKNSNDYDKNFKMHLIVFDNTKPLSTKPFYKSDGLRIEDTETDKEVVEYVTEGFLLKDRKRAIVYRPNGYGAYGFHGY
ncbi:TraB/GumN family protein [Maribacter sp. 2308TA10-17]|uniref:TraB/GumN family protein n=1 Tax=Maribacter sp. 2308TA10-17 TaxID=3386276 RepID=UPI0039BD7DEE